MITDLLNKIHNQECVQFMSCLPDNCIDLTVTSPPYDNLRTYNGFVFDFESVAKQLYRITKPGGVVVWVVADATINGSETGTSFKQALFFKDCGFNLHDTMIWKKQTFTDTGSLQIRYGGVFEYMFVLSKGRPKSFIPIKDRPTKGPRKKHGTVRQIDGSVKPQSSIGKIYSSKEAQRFNVWEINTECSNTNRSHPAQFPEQIANDHIISWSNTGDIVFDPFMGSGTTAKMAIINGRNFVGCEISAEYCEIANKRITEYGPKRI